MTPTEQLEITTPTEREVVMRRRFDAPRNLVFDALTRPELLRRWYAPPGWQLVVLFPSREVRDTILKSGLEQGASGLYEKLAALLASPARG